MLGGIERVGSEFGSAGLSLAKGAWFVVATQFVDALHGKARDAPTQPGNGIALQGHVLAESIYSGLVCRLRDPCRFLSKHRQSRWHRGRVIHEVLQPV